VSFTTFRGRTVLAARALLAGVPALLSLIVTAQGTELHLRNAADVPLVHVHAVEIGQPGDGPDHLDGQPLAPGEDVRIEIPGDACRLRLRLVWLSGASAETTHDTCDANGLLTVFAP
jgi:hypothetical protein